MIVSSLTLIVLVVKLILHGKWISAATRKVFSTSRPPRPVPAAQRAHVTPAPRAASSKIGTAPDSGRLSPDNGRCQFLQVMGVIGAASLLALVNAFDGLQEVQASTDASTAFDAANESSSSLVGTKDTVAVISESTSSGMSLDEASNNVASSNDTASFNEASSCTIRCNRGCSYSGHCRRYVDADNDNLCDLGECT